VRTLNEVPARFARTLAAVRDKHKRPARNSPPPYRKILIQEKTK